MELTWKNSTVMKSNILPLIVDWIGRYGKSNKDGDLLFNLLICLYLIQIATQIEEHDIFGLVLM